MDRVHLRFSLGGEGQPSLARAASFNRVWLGRRLLADFKQLVPEGGGNFFKAKNLKIMDFSIAKVQKSGRFPQRSVEPFFHNIFEFRLQISRSRDPPVYALSHRAGFSILITRNCANFKRKAARFRAESARNARQRRAESIQMLCTPSGNCLRLLRSFC